MVLDTHLFWLIKGTAITQIFQSILVVSFTADNIVIINLLIDNTHRHTIIPQWLFNALHTHTPGLVSQGGEGLNVQAEQSITAEGE